MDLKQQADDPVTDFIKRFKKMISRCTIQFFEVECATTTIGNMHSQLREKLLAQEYAYLSQLAFNASIIKQFIIERKQRRANLGNNLLDN